MYTVYVLQSPDGQYYKGMTNNLARRLTEHRNGKTRTTRLMADFIVAYTEQYFDFETARKRELYFKTAAGRRYLKNKLHKDA